MTLEGSLNADGQLSLIYRAESMYLTGKGKIWMDRFGEYSPLHHPYADAMRDTGEVIMTEFLQPKSYSKNMMQARKELAGIIVNDGGAIVLDSEFGANFLEFIIANMPKSDIVRVTQSTWEARLIEYGNMVLLPAIKKALALEDNETSEKATGYSREELLDLSAFAQAYLLAKREGIEAVGKNI